MSTLFEENLKGLQELFGNPDVKRGVTGVLDENGQIRSDPNYGLPDCFTWFRENGQRGAVAVLNVSVTTQRANVPVIVETNLDGALEIMRLDTDNARFTYGKFAPALNMPDRIPEQDKSSIPHRRIKDLRLRLDSSGGLVLYLDKGVYQKTNGDLVAWNGGTIDVTASLPGTVDTKRIVLVGITTSTNLITQSAATAIATSVSPTEEPWFSLSDFVAARNAAAAGILWLWGFGLLNGETSIGNTDRFVDLRAICYEEPTVYTVTASSPLASSGGSAPNISLTGIVPIANGGTGQVTAIAAFNALSPLTTKADVLTNDGTNDIRLAVGSTNGMLLRVNSATASGLEWTAIGNTFEATLATSGNTVTTVFSYTVAELVTVTIHGHYTASKTDKSFAAGGSFRASYRRPTAGNVALVGTGWIEQETDSVGVPVISVDADTGTQTARIRWQGVTAEDWVVKIWYQVIAY